MTDAEVVKRETNIPYSEIPEGLRALTADLCRLSMGQLLVLVEQVEAVDADKGKMVRGVWERRRDCAQLRDLLRGGR